MATRRSYSKSFKIEAVRLLGLGEKPASQLAHELGIRRNQLYMWRDQIEGKTGVLIKGDIEGILSFASAEKELPATAVRGRQVPMVSEARKQRESLILPVRL